jgi:trk system potassium uptake protein TrkH
LYYNTGTSISEVDSLYEAVSAFATVGNSVGVTQLANTFARMVLTLTMFVGRVGPVSMGISLAAQRPPRTVRRAVPPTADISVG